MSEKKLIIKFEKDPVIQTVKSISKVIGLVKAKNFIPIITELNLEANPRSSKVGAVTDAIEGTLESNADLFPFMSKGILLASSKYETLDRGRFRIEPDNLQIEGILDGGHNTLAIGLHILREAFKYQEKEPLNGYAKTWDTFKEQWLESIDVVKEYLDLIKDDPTNSSMDFLIPVELIIPSSDDLETTREFTDSLLEICEARNNNVELSVAAKANQKGHFADLRELMEQRNEEICERVEWKTNEGGDIKIQDLVALTWLPLNLLDKYTDENGNTIEHIAANKLYSSKGACLKHFERLMSSPEVTVKDENGYNDILVNASVKSALRIAVDLPELYDFIYERFPAEYNNNGGHFLAVQACKALNEKRRVKYTPFRGKSIENLTPDGFIMPLFFGLQALMECYEENGVKMIRWIEDPFTFLENHFKDLVADFMGNIQLCNYDPQKVGKAMKIYNDSVKAYRMALNNLL